MKTNNIVYLTDEYIYLKNKKKKDIIRYKINDGIISGGKISNIKNFIIAPLDILCYTDIENV